jgi:hypothetical protein
MTIAEAANRLSVSKRSVHNYINKGFVRRAVRNSEVLVHRDDVEQLAEEKGTDFPALNRRTLHELNQRLRKIEEQMVMVQEIWSSWGVVEKPLRPNPQEAAGLHKAVTDYLTADQFLFEEIETWAGIFAKIDEQALTRVAEAVQTVKPWEPFHQLVNRMLAYVSASKEAKKSLPLQALKAKLEVGRRKVREAALLWVESGRGTVEKAIFKGLDSPKEDLLRAIQAKGSKNP